MGRLLCIYIIALSIERCQLFVRFTVPQIKAKHTLYQLFVRFTVLNTKWEIEEYNPANDPLIITHSKLGRFCLFVGFVRFGVAIVIFSSMKHDTQPVEPEKMRVFAVLYYCRPSCRLLPISNKIGMM